jgi:hypothetical protein
MGHDSLTSVTGGFVDLSDLKTCDVDLSDLQTHDVDLSDLKTCDE